MVSYQIIDKRDNKIFLEYQPEGKGIVGFIAFDMVTRERIVMSWSPDDPCHTFGIALWNGIEENLDEGYEIRDSGVIMWY